MFVDHFIFSFLTDIDRYFPSLLINLIILGPEVRLGFIDTLFGLLNVAFVDFCGNIDQSLVKVSELCIQVSAWFAVKFFLARMSLLVTSSQVLFASVAS